MTFGRNPLIIHHIIYTSFFIFFRMLEENLPFQQKLHIVYLTNDLLHHSRKKDLPQIKEALEVYILPIVAMTFHNATPEQQAKLKKVLEIWSTQKFFDKDETNEVKRLSQQIFCSPQLL